jgi:hypothetical protein
LLGHKVIIFRFRLTEGTKLVQVIQEVQVHIDKDKEEQTNNDPQHGFKEDPKE